ncbi:DNA polymerase ii large subunit-like protein [Colletotrichum truncatum]|uniref:DNA polymerase ii large subunit-like protein n=1 Tax=Colletotrichum truncatum TaxID=5467 RepID=A0ACC3Z5T0_COLTU|nr:DNA polymerase ii large subunit-like protein [Colletotrichum truncatum]KAF6787258.1 DNA polymerase ii large subunit-like protein [Colletotrichum truncatum]
MDSDESDFYGDEEMIAGLESRVTSFNVAQWMKEMQAAQLDRIVKSEPYDSRTLHNPYAGIPFAWQLTETVEDFLARLPPETTEGSNELPWIFICNPYIRRKGKLFAQNQLSRGNEDEAPEEEGSQLTTLIDGGTERLEILSKFMNGIQKTSKSMALRSREIDLEKRRAVQDVLALAHACRVRAGKWMLFCQPCDVNEVWGTIARATANNELGIAAKVAPRQDATGRKDRVIAIYTADFSDIADVSRVLRRLRELKVVEAMGRPIYYKPDAFTYIGIAYGNTWDIKASIYSSLDVTSKTPASRGQEW